MKAQRKATNSPKAPASIRNPLIQEQDMLILAQGRIKLSQKEILNMHVKNADQLNLKQKRSLMGHIQAQRAMHAKEVFLKELGAIGSKLKADKMRSQSAS